MVKENNCDDGDVKFFPKIIGIALLLKNESSTSHCSENWPSPRSNKNNHLVASVCFGGQLEDGCLRILEPFSRTKIGIRQQVVLFSIFIIIPQPGGLRTELGASNSKVAKEAMFGKYLNHKSDLSILIWPTEVPFSVSMVGTFGKSEWFQIRWNVWLGVLNSQICIFRLTFVQTYN